MCICVEALGVGVGCVILCVGTLNVHVGSKNAKFGTGTCV